MAEKIRKSTKNAIWFVIGSILILAAIVLIVLYGTGGEVKTEGAFSDPEKAVSVTCTSKVTSYPFFKDLDADKKEIMIRVVADGDNIESLSLVNKLYYPSEDKITESRDRNHYELNEEFANDGLEADAYEATYSTFDDRFQFNIYAASKSINSKALKYFMLGDLGVKNRYRYEDAISLYNKQGFKCEENK